MDDIDIAGQNPNDLSYYLRLFDEVSQKHKFQVLYALRESEGGLTLNELKKRVDGRLEDRLDWLEEVELVVSWTEYFNEAAGTEDIYRITGTGVELLRSIESYLEAERRALSANSDTTEGRIARTLGTSQEFSDERISVIAADDDLPDDADDRTLILRVERDKTE